MNAPRRSASWAPHWMHRMDHYYERHRDMRTMELFRLPSEYFREHAYLTFQDDRPAFRMTGLLNPRRLMWANVSRTATPLALVARAARRHAGTVTQAERQLILHDNVAELYGMPSTH